ncbi:domain of Kin17 curved DNA-binding protein-domain-containing protein [Ochromonadaceae sp. CCMP2298]|nr:domain of Kin17 curved DNA-binding protein-domain-containing protein [Ochromonadaceae sp. CCMP2298]
MPKHDPLSAKGIANRQKTVGLQRLRWYCQMCEKQCRDENGFKCHTMSESHLRQMRVFADNPNSVLDEFSTEFERGYLHTLSSLHGCKRVKANLVYQEYIADKHHIHMNATAWTALTAFIMHLGKESKAIVDETEKGWFIQFIDRDPKVLARQAAANERQRNELDEEDRRKRDIKLQIAGAQERGGGEEEEEVDKSLVRDDDQKVAVSIKRVAPAAGAGGAKRARVVGFGAEEEEEEVEAAGPGGVLDQMMREEAERKDRERDRDGHKGQEQGQFQLQGQTTSTLRPPSSNDGRGDRDARDFRDGREGRGCRDSRVGGDEAGASRGESTASSGGRKENRWDKSATEARGEKVKKEERVEQGERGEMGAQEEKGEKRVGMKGAMEEKGTKESVQRRDYWLQRDIVVKVASHSAPAPYRSKGKITRVHARYEADVEIDGVTYRLHQRDLATVIPRVGQRLLLLNGKGRGCEAELLAIREADFCVDVRVVDAAGPLHRVHIEGVEYEDVSKYTP